MRVHNHGWWLDPVVRSLLDADFHKLHLLPMIGHLHPGVQPTFSLINRCKAGPFRGVRQVVVNRWVTG